MIRLSVRAWNTLVALKAIEPNEVRRITKRQLVKRTLDFTDGDLLKQRGCGRKTLNEITAVIGDWDTREEAWRRHLDDKARRLFRRRTRRCGWKSDEDGVWHSNCGREWVSEAGGTPWEHGMVFCYGCGRRLEAAS